MLNPKLREIYTEGVIEPLEELARYFENKNEKAYVFDTVNKFGIIAPMAILWDNKDLRLEGKIEVHKCYNKYTENLTPEEEEEFGGLTNICTRATWADFEKDVMQLWV